MCGVCKVCAIELTVLKTGRDNLSILQKMHFASYLVDALDGVEVPVEGSRVVRLAVRL